MENDILDDFRPPKAGFFSKLRPHLPLLVLWAGVTLTFLYNGYFDEKSSIAALLATVASFLSRKTIVFWILSITFLLSLLGFVTIFPGRIYILIPLDAISISALLFLIYINEDYVRDTWSTYRDIEKSDKQNAQYAFYRRRFQSKSTDELKGILSARGMNPMAKAAAKDLLLEEE